MSKALITGVNGFIGKHLYGKLSKEGHEVLGIGRSYGPAMPNMDYRQADVRNRQLMAELVQHVDIVYHLAAQTSISRSFQDPQLTFDVNIGGTDNILRACFMYGVKLVFAGSSLVYGNSHDPLISEDSVLGPKSPYAESKLEAEKLCLDNAQRNGIDVAVLRFFSVYGPLQTAEKGAIIPLFSEGILNGKPPEIYGDGTRTNDFIYIKDAIKAFDIAPAIASTGQPVNIGTGVGTSINQLVETLLRLTDSRLEPTHVEMPHYLKARAVANISRARALGFNPEVTLEQGLREYLEWLVKNERKQING